MKYLTLVRHAAAVHDSSFRDFDRPLRDKGIRKSISNSEIIVNDGIKPDLFVSSPAARALQTAELFTENSGIDLVKQSIITEKSLYLPSAADILDCVRKFDDDFNDVFLFSHNNGISWAAQQFCNDRSILMPTGCAVRISFDSVSWKDVDYGSGKTERIYP